MVPVKKRPSRSKVDLPSTVARGNTRWPIGGHIHIASYTVYRPLRCGLVVFVNKRHRIPNAIVVVPLTAVLTS